MSKMYLFRKKGKKSLESAQSGACDVARVRDVTTTTTATTSANAFFCAKKNKAQKTRFSYTMNVLYKKNAVFGMKKRHRSYNAF